MIKAGPVQVHFPWEKHSAMRGTLEVRTPLGWIVARMPTRGRRWCAYISCNATPWGAWWAVGPGIYSDDKARATVRRAMAMAWLRNEDTKQVDEVRP